MPTEGHHHQHQGYGSVRSSPNSDNVHGNEEGKYRSESPSPQPTLDFEQMRLHVSTYRQQQTLQEQQSLLNPSKDKLQSQTPGTLHQLLLHNINNDAGGSSLVEHAPPFAPETYHLAETRRRRSMLLWGLVGGLLIGALLMKFWTNTTMPTSHQRASDSASELPTQFDYIVVGGGPSGIIAATALARQLPDAQVVLLESGSVSQSSVLKSLKKQRKSQATRTTKTDTTIQLDLSGNMQWQPDYTTTSTTLNKYDIPLMWSGIASTLRRVQETFGLEPNPKSSTYWPIPLALLVRGLGGCGLHNAMINVRALPTCFQRWNLTGWSFDQMLPIYKRLESYVPRQDLTAGKGNTSISIEDKERLEAYRGQSGPMIAEQAGPDTDQIGKFFIEAALNSGFPLAGGDMKSVMSGSFNQPDPNDRVGVGYYEFNIHNGVRHSVATAMLVKNESSKIPSNLMVLTDRTVTQVLWSKPNSRQDKPKAIGVTYMENESGEVGKILLRLDPTSEVILATGAIMTPQLLWNSGIGDGASLVDLPGVGKNLQDHPVLGMAFEITEEMTKSAPQMYAVSDEMEDYKLAVQVLRNLEAHETGSIHNHQLVKKQLANRTTTDRMQQWRAWAKNQLGSLGTAGFSAGGFLRSPWAEKHGQDAAPDIQLTVFPRVIEPHQPKSKDTVDVKFMRARAMLVTVALLQPEARYQVVPSNMTDTFRVVGSDYYQQDKKGDQVAAHFAQKLKYPLPSIQLPDGKAEYLTDKDVRRLAWGMEQVRGIFRHAPMSRLTTKELYPGKSVVTDGGVLYQYIRTNHLANSHWAGTTKMSRDDDPMGVLDESMRVRGVHGLRVFDSGAMPFVPNGNTHSTICAVASRGVDLIVEERTKAKKS